MSALGKLRIPSSYIRPRAAAAQDRERLARRLLVEVRAGDATMARSLPERRNAEPA